MKFFSILAVALSAAFAAASPVAEAEPELVARQTCGPCANGRQTCYHPGIPAPIQQAC